MEKQMKYLTKDETRALYKTVYAEKRKCRKRNIAVFEVCKYCALRVSEVHLLKVSYYDRSSATMYCERLKGSNSNSLKIVDQHVLKALNDYLDEREEEGIQSPYLFVSQKGLPLSRQRMDAMMKEYCKKAKCISSDKWHMHVLRHTRAIELIEFGFDIDDVQYWLGHKNSENTFRYLAYTPALKKVLYRRLSHLESGSYTDRYKK